MNKATVFTGCAKDISHDNGSNLAVVCGHETFSSSAGDRD